MSFKLILLILANVLYTHRESHIPAERPFFSIKDALWRISDPGTKRAAFTTVMNGEVFGATDPATGLATKVQDRAYTARDYYWPIPEKEMLSNPNMEQNDDY